MIYSQPLSQLPLAGIKGNIYVARVLKKYKTKYIKNTDFIFGPPIQILRTIILEVQNEEIKCWRISGLLIT